MRRIFFVGFIFLLQASSVIGQSQTIGDTSLKVKKAEASSNYFSISIASIETRFTFNDYNCCDKNSFDLSNRNLFSLGIELQLAYHFSNKWSVISGVNYQTMLLKTAKERYAYYDQNSIFTATIRELQLPLLLKYNLPEVYSGLYFSFTSGIYYNKPLFEEYIVQRKIYGGGGSHNPDIIEKTSDDYFSFYFGTGINVVISQKFRAFGEPFFFYQLKENYLSERIRRKLWYGAKIGLSYTFSFSKTTN